MTRALPVDQRKKIVNAYEQGLGTAKEIAQMFGITVRSVFRYLKLSREYGDLSPEPTPGRPPILNDEHLTILKKIILKNSDWTLEEYRQALYKQTGIEVGITTIHNSCNILNLNRKKKVSSLKNKTGRI